MFGDQSVPENITPTFVYVIFWVGLVPASVIFGNVFHAFNPWRAVGRAFAWVASKALGAKAGAGLPYPDWLGNWPAAAGLIAFAWIELLSPDGTSPRTIAAAALLYSALTFLGMGAVRRRAMDPAGGGLLRLLRPLLPHLDLRP